MESCNAVEKEVDKVLSKFGSINDHAGRTLYDLITYIEGLRKQLDDAGGEHELTKLQEELLRQAMAKTKETVSRLATDHRDLHSTVSKVGKSIDRNFVSDFSATSREDAFMASDRIKLMNKVICQHYYRQGIHDVADELAKEADIDGLLHEKEPYQELNAILDSLKINDLQPALHWAMARRTELEKHSSTLEFKLHRLHYIELLKRGIDFQQQAIAYARKNFLPFVVKHEREIQTLMGMLLFIKGGFVKSPYKRLMESDLWLEIYDLFARDACMLLGVSVNSPLSTCVNAGCTAIPALLNIKQVMLQRQVASMWNGKDELPIEIDLGTDSRYHSMFACPILKQQSTENNPPMRLICGHVISKDALNKLCSGNKMKCPYCPVEQGPSDARLIFF